MQAIIVDDTISTTTRMKVTVCWWISVDTKISIKSFTNLSLQHCLSTMTPRPINPSIGNFNMVIDYDIANPFCLNASLS